MLFRNRRNLISLCATAALAFANIGCPEDDPDPPPPPVGTPNILAFSASATSVLEGGTVTLTWNVENATSVKIDATAGDAPLAPSTMLSGSVMTPAITTQTTFTITASKEGATSATKSIVVDVMAPAAVRVDSFAANPTTIDRGDMSTLSWRTTNATSVKIDVMNGANVVAAGNMLEGSTTVMPDATTVYVITAEGPMGPATSMATVTVNEPVPVINSFNAMPDTITEGDSSTLSWMVTGATSIDISDAGGTSVYSGADAMSTVTVTPAATTTYTLTATNQFGMVTDTEMVTVNAPPNAMVNSFTASPDTITWGGSAVLAWDVTNATGGVEITSSATTTPIVVSMAATGMFTVTPTRTTDYTLVAKNPAGDGMAMETVTVDPATPSIDSFTATPNPATLGGQVTLEWSTTLASRVRIWRVAPNTMELLDTTTSVGTGTISVTATSTLTTFNIEATNPFSGVNQELQVTVLTDPPTVDAFAATPNPGGVNMPVELSWQTTGAQRVIITETSTNGTVILDRTGGSATGTISATLTSTVNTFNIQAINPFGSALQNLSVVGELAAEVNFFEVEPSVYVGTTTVAMATWNTSNATSVELWADGMQVMSFPGTATGTWSWTVNGSSELTLRAVSQGGEDTSVRTILAAMGEGGTPNERPQDAQQIASGSNTLGTVGSSTVGIGDRDWYAVTVTTPGSSIWAQTSDGAGGCDFDTRLEVFDTTGTATIAANDDGGFRPCSLVDPATASHQGARNLEAGTYYVRVRGYTRSSSGFYVLDVRVIEPECGNGLTEGLAMEQCDDGNTMDGDNCTAMCQYPLIDTIIGPSGMTVSYTDGIAPVGDQDVFLIDMQIAGYIFAETFAAARPDCDGADTRLRLFDSQGTELGNDDSDGTNSCSQIDGLRDDWAFVPAGQYFLRVEDDGNNDEIVTYTVEIRTLGEGCGNGILETRAPLLEECDDGNGTDGDGCDSQCLFEGTRDTEPNNDLGSATALPVSSTAALALGSIDPSGDEDWYEITVTSSVGAYIEARTYVPTLGQCVSGRGDTIMTLYDSTGASLGSNDDFGGTRCSQFDPSSHDFTRVGPGTYYIRVTAFGGGVIDNYVLEVSFRAVNVCGNDFSESQNNEECDDGNLTNGDGCSDACLIEFVGSVTGTITQVTFNSDEGFQVFTVDVTTPGASITATAADANGMCTVDTDMTAFRGGVAATAVRIAGDVNDGPGDCAAFHYPADRGMTDLSTGTYSLVVTNRSGMPGSTVLTHGIIDPECGNRLTETNNNEMCDDGNNLDNDGCSGTCSWEGMPIEFEPNETPALANTITSTIFTGSISPAGDRDLFALFIPNGWHLTTYQSVGTLGDCPTSDPRGRLTLTQQDGVTTRASSAFSGFNGNCGRLAPDNFASTVVTNIPGGTYFLRVEEDGDDAEIGQYWVHVDLLAPGCGNGLVEANLNEQCDDGNTTANDGCSATCTVEGVFETEPNDSIGDASDSTLVGTGTVTVAGLIDPAAESDYWLFEVPAGQTLSMSSRVFGTFGDRDTCNGDTIIQLWDETGSFMTGNDDINFPANPCSHLNGVTLTEGLYFLQVTAYGSSGAFGYYADIILR